ncbi:MAG: hypothetical protein ACI8QS_003029, partial [Planctomycetota bacterium]
RVGQAGVRPCWLRQPENYDFDITFHADHDVVGLDIAVNKTSRVGGGKTTGEA